MIQPLQERSAMRTTVAMALSLILMLTGCSSGDSRPPFLIWS
jgi:hypothetical protein